MKTPPDFLTPSTPPAERATHRPQPPVRRGEWIAWLCTLGVAAVAGVFLLRDGRVPGLTFGILLVFLIAALIISMGNWLDASTSVSLSSAGIRHHSPLRVVDLAWPEVDELWAMPAGKGWRIVVRGKERHFTFRTASQMLIGTDRAIQVGYEQGEEMAAQILAAAGLSSPSQEGASWLCSRG